MVPLLEQLYALLQFRTELQLYHWATRSFSRHTASDALYKAIEKATDTWAEAGMGSQGRPSRLQAANLRITPWTDESAAGKIRAFRDLVLQWDIQDVSLGHLREEMITQLDKTAYLFTLQ